MILTGGKLPAPIFLCHDWPQSRRMDILLARWVETTKARTGKFLSAVAFAVIIKSALCTKCLYHDFLLLAALSSKINQQGKVSKIFKIRYLTVSIM